MILKIKNNFLIIPVMFIMAGMFCSCVNNINEVNKISIEPNTPDQTSEQLHVVYTDSGIAHIEIFATISESYTKKEITEFKDGLKVNFFNDSGKVDAVLTSLYGRIDNKTGNITVKDSVKFVNLEQNKTLETEILHWNKKSDSVYTNEPVVITTSNMILSGVGAWTTPAFDTAQFYQPTAELFLKD